MEDQQKIVIAFPGDVSKIETAPDHGLRLRIDTPELSPATEVMVFATRKTRGFFTYATHDFDDNLAGHVSQTLDIIAAYRKLWAHEPAGQPFSAYLAKRLGALLKNLEKEYVKNL